LIKPALLALENGIVFQGTAFGAEGETTGEIVFNTAMSGYQEILTDPSYAQQIITFTHPHIGNVGTNTDDEESTKIWAHGLIMRNAPRYTSNWRSQQSLQDYLHHHNIIGITGIDTRQLTRLLRDQGALNGCLMTGTTDPQQALAAARAFRGLSGVD